MKLNQLQELVEGQTIKSFYREVIQDDCLSSHNRSDIYIELYSGLKLCFTSDTWEYGDLDGINIEVIPTLTREELDTKINLLNKELESLQSQKQLYS